MKSVEVATPSTLIGLVEENTSAVQAASLKSRNVTLPVGNGASPRKVAVSRTAVPTGPPGDAVATKDGGRFWITMVNVWHACGCSPLEAQTVVGPKVPAWVGTPTRMPDGAMVRPVGRDPLVTENVGAGERLLVNWWV